MFSLRVEEKSATLENRVVTVCVCVCFMHARKLCRTGETQECVHSVIKLTSMQTNPHVRTGTMGIPREGQCKQIGAELQQPPHSRGLHLEKRDASTTRLWPG